MHKKTPAAFSVPLVGGSSLLVIFAVLTLTIFALLSFSTVQADARLSAASAQAVTDYYAADCAAQEILARLRAGETVAGVTVQNDIYTYRCTISENQVLKIAVQLHENGEYTILRWQAIPQGDWTPDDRLPVWSGE